MARAIEVLLTLLLLGPIFLLSISPGPPRPLRPSNFGQAQTDQPEGTPVSS
jgi:hypothetical protein